MKDLFKTGVSMAVCAIGWFAGIWTWDNVLEKKANGILSKVGGEESKDGRECGVRRRA